MSHRHAHALRISAGIAALCLALSSIGPSFAQSVGAQGTWLAGPDGAGAGTILGRIETPRVRQNVSVSTSLLVSGWAADLTASGSAGIDGLEVWSGAKDSGGTKVASGSVGLARADVADAAGPAFTNSGFSAVVPANVWTDICRVAPKHCTSTCTRQVKAHGTALSASTWPQAQPWRSRMTR